MIHVKAIANNVIQRYKSWTTEIPKLKQVDSKKSSGGKNLFHFGYSLKLDLWTWSSFKICGTMCSKQANMDSESKIDGRCQPICHLQSIKEPKDFMEVQGSDVDHLLHGGSRLCHLVQSLAIWWFQYWRCLVWRDGKLGHLWVPFFELGFKPRERDQVGDGLHVF